MRYSKLYIDAVVLKRKYENLNLSIQHLMGCYSQKSDRYMSLNNSRLEVIKSINNLESLIRFAMKFKRNNRKLNAQKLHERIDATRTLNASPTALLK